MPDPVPFPEDTVHATYDRDAVTRFWRALLSVEAVLRAFRARFPGKAPPVQLWWGSFDLAMTLYTGRPVTPPEGADTITRLGGDAEQFCAGFWPGDHRLEQAAFFAYLYPKPDGVEDARWWNDDLGELVRPYDDIRTSDDPRRTLLEFVEYAYGRLWPDD